MMWIVSVWNWLLCFALTAKIVWSGVPGIKLKTTNIFSDVTEYPAMSAVIGSTVSLPCNLSPPSPDDAISLVLWYRLDLSNPVYTLDARTTPADKAKHFSGKVLGSRAYFNVSGHRPSLASLRIDPVEGDDGGEYRCRVDFRRGRTLARMIKLNVIVPTNSLVIKDKDNRSLSGIIGPYTEKSSLTLVCEAEGGRPPPSVTWWKEKSGLVDDTYEVDGSIVRNELILENLQRDDLNSQLTCQASNTNLTTPKTLAVTIDLNLNPINVQIMSLDRPVSAGEMFEVICKTEGSRPAARISWWKDEDNLDHFATETVYNDVTTSRLRLEPESEDNGKVLICRAENPDMDKSALEDQWTLNVYYPPIVSLKYSSNGKSEEPIREGSDVIFECRIQANPPVTDIRWRFLSKPINHDPARGILILRNHTLLLQNVRKKSRGVYRCIATNLEGDGVSEEVNLQVQFPPVCSSHQRSIYGVARHEETNISCQVDADPNEVSFRWSFNNSLGESIDVLSYSSDGPARSVARYVPRTKLDYGALFCFARNDVGSMKNPCVFAVVPTGPPESVQNCSVTNQTSSVLVIACEAGDDGGLMQSFHLEVYSMTAEQLLVNMTSTDFPTFVVERLPPSSSFILVIYASNVKGRSASAALTASTLFSAEPRTGDNQHLTISALLVVLMGVVGALVLFAIIIIFIMKARGDKRRNRDKKKEKNPEEKIPTPIENSFEDKQPDIFNSKNFQTEYVDLTPNARTERIYESLGDSREYTYENVIHKASFAPNQNPHSHHIPSIVAR